MNVLEKILGEIEEATYQEDAPIYVGNMEVDGYVRASRVKDIIRSHMDEAKDTNVLINDDMEEKIREHIAECLHRTDNIRSFIGSKEYTNNDEKCIRNIEVLKASITAMEGYLSSKKKSGNDGWIPVGERLPEDDRYILLSFENFSLPLVGRYEENEKGGAFYLGDCDEEDTCISNDLYVNAWTYLPERYRGDSNA